MKLSKHLITYALATLFSLSVVTSCDKLIPPNPDPPPDVPHPRDEAPSTYFRSGPADASTVNADSVTFLFYGNLPEMVFQYRLDSTDIADWSNWSARMDTASVTLRYLNEGPHTFEVRAGYSADKYDSIGVSRNFTVQAYENTLRFNPSDVTLPIGSSGTIELMAEEVIDLMAVITTIFYNRNYVLVDSVSDGSFMTNKGNVWKFGPKIDNQAGTIEINMAVDDQTITGQTEGGPVVTIHFTCLVAVTTYFNLSESGTTLIDLNNNRIQPSNLGKARIIITTGQNDR